MIPFIRSKFLEIIMQGDERDAEKSVKMEELPGVAALVLREDDPDKRSKIPKLTLHDTEIEMQSKLGGADLHDRTPLKAVR